MSTPTILELLGPVSHYPKLAPRCPPEAHVARLSDGSRAVVIPHAGGPTDFVGYVHGPDIKQAVEDRGFTDGMRVRIRDAPEACFPFGPPPGYEQFEGSIPEELRGRIGTLRLPDRYIYKYAATVDVHLHRRRPREPREQLELPVHWLEAAPEMPPSTGES